MLLSVFIQGKRFILKRTKTLIVKFKIYMTTGKKSNNDTIQNSNGVGKKFLIISISLTILLNGSVAIWFFWYAKKYGIEKFIS